MASFADQVGQWIAESEERLTAARRRAIEIAGEEAAKTKPQGGRVPFMTGNLARSLLASTSGMPKTAEGPFTGSNVGAVAATLQLDQPVWIGYQANYARRANYGFVGADSKGRVYNQPGNYFLEALIAEWPNIVARAVAEIKK